LEVNATSKQLRSLCLHGRLFQWAPTLGGECYRINVDEQGWRAIFVFQWAPTLGGECYTKRAQGGNDERTPSFNGHPPLGVNATAHPIFVDEQGWRTFQWAPTLGGECYRPVRWGEFYETFVSMGTHPWG